MFDVSRNKCHAIQRDARRQRQLYCSRLATMNHANVSKHMTTRKHSNLQSPSVFLKKGRDSESSVELEQSVLQGQSVLQRTICSIVYSSLLYNLQCLMLLAQLSC
eukprot:2242118-Amphidinium_carterae.1